MALSFTTLNRYGYFSPGAFAASRRPRAFTYASVRALFSIDNCRSASGATCWPTSMSCCVEHVPPGLEHRAAVGRHCDYGEHHQEADQMCLFHGGIVGGS